MSESNKLQILAFYLPQFHPVKENDEWWGKGFTEWTNVAKAKPLFEDHNQPRIPADLGFYDLRVPEVREQQVQLAKEAGVTAFCYWHYWFGSGKRLLERVFDEVLESGAPDFPFCLGWANHSWYAKTWDKDKNRNDKLLMGQTYPGIEDAREHFNYLQKAFKDKRYVKVHGKPFLLIFDPKRLPLDYIEWFHKWAKEEGFDGIYLVAHLDTSDDKDFYISQGYDAVVYNRISTGVSINSKLNSGDKNIYKYLFAHKDNSAFKLLNSFRKWFIDVFYRVKPKPKIVDYSKYYHNLVTDQETAEDTIPQLVPQWDHTPRSGVRGTVWVNADSQNFYEHAKQVLSVVKNKPEESQIVLLKSWNEWGEGNYMEPDQIHGKGFIEALRKAIKVTYNNE